MIIILKLMY